jgi:hypothetical protein
MMTTPAEEAERRKTELEIAKLELDIEHERARTGIGQLELQKAAAELEELRLENERREREKQQAATAEEKLRLDVQDLRRSGRIWWPRIQVLAVVGGVVVSTFTYWLSVHQAHDKDIQTAAEHLQNGYPSGAVELGRYPDALGILVRSVDATHRTEQKSWPVVTLAALDEIYRRRTQLDDQQKRVLRNAMNESDVAIKLRLTSMAAGISQPSAPTTSTPVGESQTTRELEDYVCIQLALQNALAEKPQDWDKTYASVLNQLVSKPHC